MFKRESKKRRFNLDWLAVATLAVMLILPAQARALVIADAGPDQETALGQTVQLQGAGIDTEDPEADFYFAWGIISRPTGSMALLSSVVISNPTITPDIPGIYEIGLTVCSLPTWECSERDTVVIHVSTPVAYAGPDQTVHVGNQVQLQGWGDETHGTPYFRWELSSKPEGSGASLSDAFISNPTFVADVWGDYLLTLEVETTQGDVTTDTVWVYARWPEQTFADAGPDQNASVGQTVQLQGSAEDTAGGSEFDVKWRFLSKPAGSASNLSSAYVFNPTFVPDLPGDYVIKFEALSLTNWTLDQDEVVIHVLEAPWIVADAGPDQDVAEGDLVELQGYAEDSEGGSVFDFCWCFASRPEGSAATIWDQYAQNPAFVPDVPGDYEISVNVCSLTNSECAQDTVLIHVTETPGDWVTAYAGPDQEAVVGETVQLQGYAWDSEGGSQFAFRWWFILKPPGSGAQISGNSTQYPSFVADIVGNYEIEVEVLSLSTWQYAYNTVLIHVPETPVINWASMNIWDSPGFELFMWATGNFDVTLENDDISLYANGERLPMELIEQDGGFVYAYGAPGPPLPTEYKVTIRDQWATSEPYLIGVLKGYPQGAPEMLYPEDGQLITETQPTFRWEDFKSLYDGQPIDAVGYEINLTFPNGLTYTVCPISGDQITLDYINPHWTPSQPPGMLPGIYGVTVHSVHSVAPGFGFEHHGGIHFEVIRDPVQLVQSLAESVIDLNLQTGIENSLDTKLDAALKAIEDLNENNDVAAVNSLGAFINAVEAQRGNKIQDPDADALIAAAQQIVDLLLAE